MSQLKVNFKRTTSGLQMLKMNYDLIRSEF
jgi:hypothetical protein